MGGALPGGAKTDSSELSDGDCGICFYPDKFCEIVRIYHAYCMDSLKNISKKG